MQVASKNIICEQQATGVHLIRRKMLMTGPKVQIWLKTSIIRYSHTQPSA